MLFLFDREERLLRPLPREWIKDAHITESINAAKTLEVYVADGAPVDDAVFAGWYNKDRGTLELFTLISLQAGDVACLTGVEAAWDELSADGYVREKRPRGQSLVLTLSDILEGSRWGVGKVESDRTFSGDLYYMSRIEALQKVVEYTGCEIEFSCRYDAGRIYDRKVNLFNHIGSDHGQRFEHGHNLLTVLREEKRDKICTAIVGRGMGERGFDEDGRETGGFGRRISYRDVEWSKAKGAPLDKPLGSEVLELPEATAAYGLPGGRPRVGIVEIDKIEDPELLLELTYETLKEYARPVITYQANVKDIGRVGLGDTITIVRSDLGIRYKVRVYKRERNLLKPDDIRLEMGDKAVSYSDQKLDALEQRLADYVDENATGKIQQLVEAVGKTFWGLDSYNYTLKKDNEYGLPPGYYSFDRPIDDDPTELIYIGSGRMYISDSKDSEGNWKFKTIATGSGFFAENMFAGTILADVAKLGYVEADHIRLQDGEKVTDLTAGWTTLRDDLEGLNTRLEAGLVRVADNEGRLTDIESGKIKVFDEIENRLTQVEAGKIALLQGVEGRVTVLEDQQITMQDLDRVEDRITTLANGKLSISEWSKDKSAINSDINTVERSLSNMEGKVTNIEAGKITLGSSTQGSIAGMNLSYDKLTFNGPSSKFAISTDRGDNYFLYGGKTWSDSAFVVRKDGTLYARGADISGTFSGSRATLGAWTLDGTRINGSNGLRDATLSLDTSSDFLKLYTKATDPARSFRVTRTCEVYHYGATKMSDKRLKTQIQEPAAYIRDLASKTRIVSFEWRDAPGSRQLGVLAQEIEEICPEAVKTDPDGYKAVDYSYISLATTLLAQELEERVRKLEEAK